MPAIEFALTPLRNDPNLVEYWKLEDVVAQVNSPTDDLVNVGTVTFSAAKFNNGANLGTSNTTKDLKNVGTLGWTGRGNAWSMTCWTKILTEPSNLSYGHISVADLVSHHMLELYYKDAAGTKSLNFEFTRQNVGADTCGATVTAFGTSTFHFIAGVFDGTNLSCYLDGSLIAGPTATTAGGSLGVSGFAIGNRADLPSNRFASAVIDDATCFKRALTATEISNLFNGTFGKNLMLLGIGT